MHIFRIRIIVLSPFLLVSCLLCPLGVPIGPETSAL
jgi:hypothetical protein